MWKLDLSATPDIWKNIKIAFKVMVLFQVGMSFGICLWCLFV